MSPLVFRKSWRFGPLRLNASRSGFSWTVKVGPWSWNSRTRAQRVDLPGPFSWRQSTRRNRGQS